ncbi:MULTISPECIES: TIGR04372 family glycosyltransferase [unclassified Bradyrhizobium]|uniref:TIGR04372 family glycosyltransferase n=1 Tax=unclassified Bradyrhizobium TaxID=2631580 RepID=UPI0028E486E9|nr:MULTISPECIES: TIGR04372 family glycosyltransferase [unclassified Bradyrhizobium]
MRLPLDTISTESLSVDSSLVLRRTPAERTFGRLYPILLGLLRRVPARHFLRNLAFTLLPFGARFRLTMLFRHFFQHPALDRHFVFFCGPFLGSRLSWIFRSRVWKRYPNEVAFYLLLSGYRREALPLFRRLKWDSDDSIAEIALQATGAVGDGYSMDLLTQMHFLDWPRAAERSHSLRTFVRLMLEHRNFQYEERAFRGHVEFDQVPRDVPVEQFIPYFFRDREVIERLMKDLGLSDTAGVLGKLDEAGQYWEHFPAYFPDRALCLDVYLFYAYRELLLRTYHNGEGDKVPLVYRRGLDTQRRLRRHLPKPSPELKRVLDGIGAELGDVRLLSPDWSALIGHNGHLNVHLMMRSMGWWKGQPVLLAYKDRIANKPFLSLFSEICPTLTLGENVSAGVWFELASLTPFLGDSHQAFEFQDGRCVYWNDAGAMALQKWEREGRGFPLRDIYDARMQADDRIEILYQSLREKWGLAPDDWFVCLHMRDAEARGETLGVGESIRSSNIGNYFDTVRYITSIGGWVIRMGGRKAPPMPEMPRVIDYARSEDQVPEIDIHLMRRARMFIGTTSGFAYVASSFGIPTAMVNALSSVGLLWSKDTRFALKPVHTAEGRMLSLSDVTSEQWRWTFPTYETVRSAGLTVSESSSDEILETTKEVLDLSSGRPAIQPVDDAWETRVHVPGFFGSSRPSRYFLEKYSASLLADS